MASSLETKLSIVSALDFGSGVAEDEKAELASYFLETDVWRKVWEGKVDLILAPKGGGKSAIYSTLIDRSDALAERKILIGAAENPQGEPAFQSLLEKNPSEAAFKEIWLLYFASIVSEQLTRSEIKNPPAKELHERLRSADLLSGTRPKKKVLQAVWAYVVGRLSPEKLETQVHLDSTSGMPTGITGSMTFASPAGSLPVSELLDDTGDLFELAQQALTKAGVSVWICLDRLDAAFATAPELERNALRALFRAYLDIKGYDRISLKMFLRSDIWSDITSGGFREASHIVRRRQILWTEPALLQLVTRRILKCDELVDHYHLDASAVLANSELQDETFKRVFPLAVDTGSGKTKGLFRWCLNHTRDGLGINAPRELVSLFAHARDAQVTRFETGQDDTESETLFHPKAFEAADRQVSSQRLESTIYAEYPDVKPWLEALDGEKGAQNDASLTRIWGIELDETSTRMARLVGLGVFEQRKDHYWAPFLYRPALGLIQGRAPELRDIAAEG